MSYFPIFLTCPLLDTLIYYLLLFLFKYACSKKTFFLALKTFFFLKTEPFKKTFFFLQSRVDSLDTGYSSDNQEHKASFEKTKCSARFVLLDYLSPNFTHPQATVLRSTHNRCTCIDLYFKIEIKPILSVKKYCSCSY